MSERAVRSGPRRTCIAWVASSWLVVFLVFHLYWYLGGSFASPGKLPDLIPRSAIGWIPTVIVDGGWAVGLLICWAVVRDWRGRRLTRGIAVLLLVGAAVLLLRGGAGIIDDLARAIGMPSNGLTGLSLKEESGTITQSVLWSGRAIDLYFLVGGLTFASLAWSYRVSRQESARGDVDEPQLVRRTLSASMEAPDPQTGRRPGDSPGPGEGHGPRSRALPISFPRSEAGPGRAQGSHQI